MALGNLVALPDVVSTINLDSIALGHLIFQSRSF